VKIELPNPFKSLVPFGSTELPEFTVLVGLNGMGKSQLLEGIQLRQIRCDAVKGDSPAEPGPHPAVVRLTNASLTLQSEMVVTTASADSDRPFSRAAFEDYRQTTFRRYEAPVSQMVQGTSLAGRTAAEIYSTPQADLTANLSHWANEQLQSFLPGINRSLLGPASAFHELARRGIQHAAASLAKEPRLVTYEEASTYGSWGDHALFNAQLPRLFARYRDEQIVNSRKSARADRPAAADWLDPADFEAKFGKPPWEQLSALLQTFGLNYRFAPPGMRSIDPVTLFFERLDDENTHVEFGALSAGEKVLVILAVALLNVDPVRATVQRPELLLLDEIDASLHPAVLHQWMATIREKVVGDLRIPCILTTHSPVTVAMAPESSLFEISRQTPPLRPISQREALNKLTVGLPSLQLDFTQRRQVFVEAEVDAEAYDRLQTLMKAELQLPRSLNFLSTGVKKKDGSEQGTGCAAVMKVVNDLAGFGSLSTFGLLDWDGGRSPQGRIHVLAQGSHYAFDNVILNPLLIGLLLIRDGRPPADDLPRFAGADRLAPGDLQRIADSVQSKLKYPPNAPAGRVAAHFFGGAQVDVDQAFCLCNGHEMEDALKAAFPRLNIYSGKGRGKLALEIIERVLGDYPLLCPVPFVDAFRALANADP
jgi:predicted ATPase